MYLRAGLIYRGSRGSHHHFEDPQTGKKYTLSGNPSKELGPDSWESAQAILATLGYKP